MNKVRIDNSYFMDKIFLRLNNLPSKKTIRVLDIYAGDGKIWEKIKNMADRKIEVLSIDQAHKETKIYLRGNNTKYLAALDLERFDVIDMDAYGIPYQQLEILFERSKSIRREMYIFVTVIGVKFNGIPKKLLKKLGYASCMVDKCPSLFGKGMFEKIKEYLAINGIRKIRHRSINNKHYLFFKINHNP